MTAATQRTGCKQRSRLRGRALRKTLLVSLDDLLAVVREFLNPDVSRSGLDRCLRRHGVGNLRDLKAKEARPDVLPKVSPVKARFSAL